MKILMTLISLMSFSALALTTGEKAPDFTLKGTSSKGRDITLADFKGKIVVLEWLNHGCPFVRKHYDSNNMQSLQKKLVSSNVIWFSIVSSAEGKQGFVDNGQAMAERKKYNSASTDVLLDPTGKVGNLYQAKTTPHMYVIDKEGNLAYQGAIDDMADTEQASIAGAKNYVDQAVSELQAQKKVSIASTKAYGCGIKY